MSDMKNLLKAKSEFRKKGVTLVADKTKSGAGGAWKFASEDNMIKTIQEPLSGCGLELIPIMNYQESLGVDIISVTLYHNESGESISSSISMPPVEPRKDKNGNAMYLDAEIERGKQFGYWSRTLSIRLLGLSDIDPEDMNNRPTDISDERQKSIEELKVYLGKAKDMNSLVEWITTTYNVNSIDLLSLEQIKTINIALKKKQDASS